MDDVSTRPSTPPQTASPLKDGLELWAAEARGTGTFALSAIRVDGNERLLIPFTTSLQRVSLHYIDSAALRGYVHCNGPDCLLCRTGRQVEVRDLLPVYDAIDRAVGVLAVSPNLRPQALRPQLIPVLRQLQDNRRVLLAVRKLDTVRFSVGVLPLTDEADDGAEQIRAFVEAVSAGAVDLGSIYPRLGNEELKTIAQVAAAIRMKGM